MPSLSIVPNDEQSQEIVPDFDTFWLLYPRHVAKANARKAWAKIDPALHVPIIESVAAWRPIWNTKDPEYLPHAASWLNGERWEDELPRTAVSASSAHKPFEPDVPDAPKGKLPAKIQALIAKMRAQK